MRDTLRKYAIGGPNGFEVDAVESALIEMGLRHEKVKSKNRTMFIYWTNGVEEYDVFDKLLSEKLKSRKSV